MLGFNPLASRPLSDVAVSIQPSAVASPGGVTRKRRRGSTYLPGEKPVVIVRARLFIADDDDTFTAQATVSESPAARRRRQTLNFLLMH